MLKCIHSWVLSAILSSAFLCPFLLSTSVLAKTKSTYGVQIQFEYRDLPGEIELWTVKPASSYDIFETKTKASRADLPLDKRLPSSLQIAAGEGQTFALVYENKTNQTVYFYAVPHTAKPETHALHFKFLCFCNHHVYQVPPHTTWARVVRVELDGQYESSRLSLKHIVVGLSEEKAKGQFRRQLYENTKSEDENGDLPLGDEK